MQTKPLLYGLIGFFLGGLLVAVAVTVFNEPEQQKATVSNEASMDSMSMESMVAHLAGKTGDAYDEAFITEMIAHHQGAVTMANMSAASAKHDEIKKLSKAMILEQQKQIDEMRHWQMEWKYSTTMQH